MSRLVLVGVWRKLFLYKGVMPVMVSWIGWVPKRAGGSQLFCGGAGGFWAATISHCVAIRYGRPVRTGGVGVGWNV